MATIAAQSRLGYLTWGIAAAGITGLTAYNISDHKFCAVAEAEAPQAALSPKEWRSLQLIAREAITHNTHKFRFELPNNQTAGLTVASCLLTKAAIQAPGSESPEVVVRPYTPVSHPSARGYLDLVVKVYPTGKMSKYMGDMKVGDTLDFKGPLMKYPYQPNIKRKIGMVAGGTGITPMLQVIDHVLENPEDQTELSLIFANVSEQDIIMKGKLDELAKKHPKRFKVYYIVDKPNYFGAFWNGGVGYLKFKHLVEHMPPPHKDHLVMVCGPPGMMEAVSGDKAKDKSQGELKGMLKELGYDESMVYKF